MIQTDKDRVGEVIELLARMEGFVKSNWQRDMKNIISEMEKRNRDKATTKEEVTANTGRRIPAAKVLFTSLENTAHALELAIDIKWDKYPTAEDYLKEVGAHATVLSDEMFAKLDKFNQAMSLGSGHIFLSFIPFMKELAITSPKVKADLVEVKKMLNAIRSAPARPAAQAPQRPAVGAPPVRPGATAPTGRP